MRRAALLISILLAAVAASLTLGGVNATSAWGCLPGVMSATGNSCVCSCDVSPRRQVHYNDRHLATPDGFARVRFFINARKRSVPIAPVKAKYDRLKKKLKKQAGLVKQYGIKWFKRHYKHPKKAGKEAFQACLVAGSYTWETGKGTRHKKLWRASRACAYVAINLFIIAPPK